MKSELLSEPLQGYQNIPAKEEVVRGENQSIAVCL